MTTKSTASKVTPTEPKAQVIKAKDFFADENKIGLFMFAANARMWSQLTEFGLVFPKNAPIYGLTTVYNQTAMCDFKQTSQSKKSWYRLNAVGHHNTVRMVFVACDGDLYHTFGSAESVRNNGNAGDCLFATIMLNAAMRTSNPKNTLTWQHIDAVVTSAVRDSSKEAVEFLQALAQFGLLTRSCLRAVWCGIKNEQRGLARKLKGYQGPELQAQAAKEAQVKLWSSDRARACSVESNKAFDSLYKSINFNI